MFTTVAASTGTSATTYLDDTVQPGTRYAYRVKAINDAGLSRRSTYVNVTTLAAPPPPPVVPEQPEATREPDAFVPAFEIEEVVYVPEPDVEPALIAMYQTETRVTLWTATMTVRSASSDTEGGDYLYRGFATGFPLTFGSMSETSVTRNSSTMWGCPEGGCANGTVTELYYVQDPNDGFIWNLVFRPGRKIPDGFTLTIGDDSYDLADSGYFVTNKHKYGKYPVGPDMHFWYDVGNPGLTSGDTPTVTLAHPLQLGPTALFRPKVCEHHIGLADPSRPRPNSRRWSRRRRGTGRR